MDSNVGCLTVSTLLFFLIAYTVEGVYGILSIKNCQIPAYMAVVISGAGLVLIVYWLIQHHRWGISYFTRIKLVILITLLFHLTTQAIIIALLDHRDNGPCHDQNYILNIAIALVVYQSVLLLFIIGNYKKTPVEKDERECDDPALLNI